MPIIPFGPMVEYTPISAQDQARLHQFGKKVPSGIFVDYAWYAGGIWKGDIFVADVEELNIGRVRNLCSKTQREGGSRARERQ